VGVPFGALVNVGLILTGIGINPNQVGLIYTVGWLL